METVDAVIAKISYTATFNLTDMGVDIERLKSDKDYCGKIQSNLFQAAREYNGENDLHPVLTCKEVPQLESDGTEED